jgi:lauroyl/myristoyl acyltransferase
MSPSLKSIRHRIEWLTLAAAAASIPVLGRNALAPLAQILGSAAYLLDHRSRGIALENLRVVFRDRHTESEILGIARRSFIHFAQAQLDNLWSSRLDRDNYLEFMNLDFECPDTEAIARERGAIWVTPHYGNFEWISLMFGLRGFCFRVVAQPFKNPLLDPLFTAIRERSGHQVIARNGAMLRLLRHIKNGGHAAFLLDLSLSPKQAATVITCMGRLLCTTKLHAELASRTGLPIIPAISIPRPEGGYTMRVFKPLVDLEGADPDDLAQRCWNRLEPSILADPAPWLWAYKHWRYLPDDQLKDNLCYPDYAKGNTRFNELAGRILA